MITDHCIMTVCGADLADHDDDGRADAGEEGGGEQHLHARGEHGQQPRGGEGEADRQQRVAPPAPQHRRAQQAACTVELSTNIREASQCPEKAPTNKCLLLVESA